MFWRSGRCRPKFLPCRAGQDGSIVVLEAGVRGIEQLRTGDHHDIDAPQLSGYWDAPENLSNQSFSSIPSDRIAQLSGGHHAEPRGWTLVVGNEQGQETAAHALTRIEDPLEFPAPPEPPVFPELLGRHRLSGWLLWPSGR
jgi:hypothetical protein